VSFKVLVARFLCLMLILSGLMCVGSCLADMPNPGPQTHDVEIQGAKIISEGGYLWFHVVNHDSRGVFVAIRPPSGVILMNETSTSSYLSTGESADYYFQVMYFWSGNPVFVQEGPTKELRFFFEIYTQYQKYKVTDENVEFDVNVVPLNRSGDDWNLFYFAIFALAAAVATIIVIAARTAQQDKRKNNLERQTHEL